MKFFRLKIIFVCSLKNSSRCWQIILSSVFLLNCGNPEPVTVIPPDVTNLVAIAGNRQNYIQWELPVKNEFESLFLVRRTDRFPEHVNDGIILKKDVIESFVDLDLNNDQVYYYTIFTRNSAGNNSNGVSISSKPSHPPGTALFARSNISGNNQSSFNTIVSDSDGNTYAAGYQYGTTTNVYGNVALNGEFSEKNAILIKYDPEGNEIWGNVISGNANSEILGIDLDEDGIYICGYISSTTNFDFGNSILLSGHTSTKTAFIAKYDFSGNLIWAKIPESATNQTEYRAISVGLDSSIIVAGIQSGNSSVNFGNSVSTTGPHNGPNALLVKYDSLGTPVWARVPVNAPNQSQFNSVVIDNAGQVFAAGFQLTNQAFEYGNSVQINGSSGQRNFVIVNYSINGTVNWARSTVSGSTSSEIHSLAVNSERLFAAGYMQGSWNLDFGNGFTHDPLINQKYSVLLSLNKTGQTQWLRTTDSCGGDSEANHVNINSNNLYVTGYQKGTGNCDYGQGIMLAGSSSDRNAVLLKYSLVGSLALGRTVISSQYASSFKASTVSDSKQQLSAVGMIEFNSSFIFGPLVQIMGNSTATNIVLVRYTP